MPITTITLPNGATIESTAPIADLASLLAMPAQPTSPVAVTQETPSAPKERQVTKAARPRAQRAPKTPKAAKAPTAPKGRGKEILATVRSLIETERYEEALELCPKGWVQERTAIVKLLTTGTEVPAAREPKAAEALRPTEMARRANKHKLTCSCGMCVKLGYVHTQQAGCDAVTEPKARVKGKAKRSPKGKPSDAVLTAEGPAKRVTPKASAEKVDRTNVAEAKANDEIAASAIQPTHGQIQLAAIRAQATKVATSQDPDAISTAYCEAVENVEMLDDLAEKALQEGEAETAAKLREKAAAFAEAAGVLLAAG